MGAINGKDFINRLNLLNNVRFWRAAWRLRRRGSGADITGPVLGSLLEAADRFRQQVLGQPQHDIGEEDAEGDGREEHDVDRQRRAASPCRKPHVDEFRRHQQRKPVRRRDQPERERHDDDDAHVHRIDVGVLGQVGDDRHEDDDRRDRVDEIADDDEQHDQQQHDHERIVAGAHARSSPTRRPGRADRPASSRRPRPPPMVISGIE